MRFGGEISAVATVVLRALDMTHTNLTSEDKKRDLAQSENRWLSVTGESCQEAAKTNEDLPRPVGSKLKSVLIWKKNQVARAWCAI